MNATHATYPAIPGPLDTPCWRWTGHHRSYDGRPVLGKKYAYRVVFEEVTGQQCPPGVAHHLCENSWCVNPWHLEFKTPSAHARDHDYLGALNRNATQCPQGHKYTPENTYVSRRGNGSTFRSCRTCRAKPRKLNPQQRARKIEWQRRRRAQLKIVNQ